jgi:hypothetical protein
MSTIHVRSRKLLILSNCDIEVRPPLWLSSIPLSFAEPDHHSKFLALASDFSFSLQPQIAKRKTAPELQEKGRSGSNDSGIEREAKATDGWETLPSSSILQTSTVDDFIQFQPDVYIMSFS